MEEKTLVQGELGHIKKMRNIIWLMGLILAGVMGIYFIVTLVDYIDYGKSYGWKDWMISTLMTYAIITVVIAVIFIVIGLVIYSGLSKILLVVTDKRVYGKVMFGKQVDLPLDSISALGMGMFSSIAIATSSGKITFWGISNRDEIHNIISELLQKRQSGKRKENVVTHITQEAQSAADELKKFKELLDSGIISKEEYEVKKKQLLGL